MNEASHVQTTGANLLVEQNFEAHSSPKKKLSFEQRIKNLQFSPESYKSVKGKIMKEIIKKHPHLFQANVEVKVSEKRSPDKSDEKKCLLIYEKKGKQKTSENAFDSSNETDSNSVSACSAVNNETCQCIIM